jgi:hypothetical protein
MDLKTLGKPRKIEITIQTDRRVVIYATGLGGRGGGIAVTRCYNSQMTGAAVTTPPCGIAINHTDQGFDIIDFGFEVDDRFFLR